jgi:hypothetical protein
VALTRKDVTIYKFLYDIIFLGTLSGPWSRDGTGIETTMTLYGLIDDKLHSV